MLANWETLAYDLRCVRACVCVLTEQLLTCMWILSAWRFDEFVICYVLLNRSRMTLHKTIYTFSNWSEQASLSIIYCSWTFSSCFRRKIFTLERYCLLHSIAPLDIFVQLKRDDRILFEATSFVPMKKIFMFYILIKFSLH